MIIQVLFLVLPLNVIGRLDDVNKNLVLKDTFTFKDIFEILSKEPFISTKDGGGDWSQHIMQLAIKYGYLGQEREVITEDSYILVVHRIRNGRKIYNGKVIFLMHGIEDSSDSWMIQGPGRALAYILADNGYDVWMGNARGNRHSQRHERWSTKDEEYWNFTWEEIGLYDLPAMIDYVLETTKQNSLYYVGYSQGATTFYVMSSLLPQYNNKTISMFSLAPVAWLNHVKSPMISLFPLVYSILNSVFVNLNVLSPTTNFFNKILSILCAISTKTCDNIFFIMNGNEHLFNSSLYPAMVGRIPSGSSVQQFVHYGQLMESGRFCRYDHGVEMNLETYNSTTPPDYDLTKVTVPVHLYYSDNDWMASAVDVGTLKRNLGNVVSDNFVPGFSHLDFVYANEAKDAIYSSIMETIDGKKHLDKHKKNAAMKSGFRKNKKSNKSTH